MNSEQINLISTDNSSTISKEERKRTFNQAGSHCFHVHCLSSKEILKGTKYDSVNDIKKDAFLLYKDANFNDDNAILTHLDDKNVEVLLTAVPDLLKKGHSKDLYIRFVHLGCAMCSNPFGIVDSQLLLQCSNVKCAVQYCNSCVQAIQGPPPERLFVCITCKKNMTPKRNMLIDKQIIWKSMCKLYGIQSLLDLKDNSKDIFCYSILKNIQIRRIHLKSRFNTLQSLLDSVNNQRGERNLSNSSDERLINDVNNLCIKLENLTERLKEIDYEMECRGIILENCLQKYRKGMKYFHRLCNTSNKSGAKLRSDDATVTTDKSDAENEQIKQAYRMDDLDTLPSVQNIKAIDDILEDIEYRENCLSGSKEIMSWSEKTPDHIVLLNDHLNKVEKKLKITSAVKEELNYLRKNLQAIKNCTDEYDECLRDDQFPDIPCSKFILLLEMMRVRTEELEISNSLPQTSELMKRWQNDYGTDEEFKPKVIDLCKTIELDMQDLFADYNWIYSPSYKVGVIGNGSVGKSALIMNLAEVKEFSSMINFERSTFGYLQFDTLIYEDPRSNKIIPITFVDIEGATDTDESEFTGNYIELIRKADCDLYIVVFADFFSDHNRICQQHIENNLKRKCILVRNKVDLLFNQCFRDAMGENYAKTRSREYDVKVVLKQIKDHALKTSNDKRLNDIVYLTAAVCEDNLRNASFAEFDLHELKKKLVQFAMTDFRGQRICNLVIRAAITAINTCFRRGYTVSQTKYKWLAAGASIIPFLDEIPAFFGREKIRQAFGIHDSFTVTNYVRKTKDSFEQYLTDKKMTIPSGHLKSGEFKYLEPKIVKQTATTSEEQQDTDVRQTSVCTVKNKGTISQNAQHPLDRKVQLLSGPSPIVVGATAGALVDDAARFLAPSTTVAGRTTLITGFVVTAVLAPVFATWSFYRTGQRMNIELHSVCDDLVVILQYFAVDRCNDCCQCIQPPAFLSSNEDSSSDSDDD